ncbi:glucokinase [Dictyobacter kobayashii]|uniref:Glucokinase n=1 Tax=Dictyobacter kobayashii TaxID=2014872 RepID=A0A402AUR1_9CHLR|nr:glucokinase [Dictyobacter kobayashii]GCE22789.1 glucokinase [Dictyobacter kobayashii]
MLLAGDIGGTKTNLALYASKEDIRTPLREATLPSAQYATLAALVNDFLKQIDLSNVTIDRAVFGVAGPVVAGKAKITNLPWKMEEKQLQQTLNIPSVTLLNDLAAMATAIPLLRSSDLHTLNAGKPATHGTLAVVAPGTGLGEAILTWDGAHYRVHPSEGGHVDFAPTNAFEVGLLVYLLERMSHVSYEHVCSGIGLPNIYAYIKASGVFEEPQWLADKLAQVKDMTPVIVRAAMAPRETETAPTEEGGYAAICGATVKAFASILGAETGNMVLKVLATGGVYLGGGLPPRILPFLEDQEFIRIFQSKGRFSEMLADVPVHVILNNKVALIGAASFGFDQ